ncbi:hypothetical protein V8C86DRAFT_2898597, partial [Haematococcus lacustris]
WSMRWANLHFLPWYVLSLSRAARASPEAFLFRCASVRSGCSASSRSSMSLSGSSGTGLGTVPLFCSHRNQEREAITNTRNCWFCLFA